ncbi:MAG: S8 family serine peptidase [Pseudomonadota bacterium]
MTPQQSPGGFYPALSVALLSVVLTACGGGGGGSSSGGGAPPPVPNAAPIAEAGANQDVASGATVTLNGDGSSDSDGMLSSFQWQQTEGTEVALENTDQPSITFTVPTLNADEDLVFVLTVTDDDGATSSDSVTVTVAAVAASEVTVSGRIIPSPSQKLDGDTNDPFNPLINNSDPLDPQALTNPVTLGGYVNEAGAGADGRSQLSGDREDFFAVDLLAGQTISLLVAEFQDADADLYLYRPNGQLVDFSIETGQRETIVVEENGPYLVNASIFRGATNYTLTIGSALLPGSVPNYEDVIVGQMIVSYGDEDRLVSAREALAREMRTREIGGGPRRARLLALDDQSDPAVLNNRLGKQRFRLSQFADKKKARLWDTLISIKNMARQPGVRSAEPNYRVYPLATVNDEAFNLQWHYPLINIPGAWDTTTGDPSIVVAVVDTGVIRGHPDLEGQLVDGYDFVSNAREAADGDGIDPNPEESVGGSDPAAINFHGSHVTGTVGAAGNNNIGVAGTAFGARVMPLRAITASGGTAFDVNQAIRYAAGLANDSGTVPSQPANVINLSLGGGGFSSVSQSLYNELRARGIVVVAAAGNESSTAPSFPAAYDNVISVSAVDTQLRITGYSNTGSTIDVAAPGGDGRVDLNGDGYPDGVLSTGGFDGEVAYTFLSGTSMAAPHVAGVIALMLSANPELDAADIERLLESGALTDDLGAPGRDDLYGHGVINARLAVDAALAEAGGSANLEPRLNTSTTALNFGAGASRLEFLLSNSGGGEINNVTAEVDQPWLSVTYLSGLASGLGRYEVIVDRTDLEPGIYEALISVSSDANDLTIRTLLSVADASESELGQVYLLLIDPATDQVVAQTLATFEEDGYRFVLPPIPVGQYQIFAGTDLDNDLLICDAGEACGSFLTIDQPLTVDISADRDDIEFPIEYLLAIPTEASNQGNEGGERGFKRMP